MGCWTCNSSKVFLESWNLRWHHCPIMGTTGTKWSLWQALHLGVTHYNQFNRSKTYLKTGCHSKSSTKNYLPHDPAISLPGVHPKELKTGSHTDTCILMFTAALFTVAKKWELSECPVNEWITKSNINIKQNIICLKRTEMLTYTTTWMYPEDLTLSKISWRRKGSIVWSHLHEVPTAVKFVDTESRKVVTKSWGRGKWRILFSEHSVSI